MTPRQIDLLERTLFELRRQSIFASQLFYCRLFARRPGLRRLFAGRPDFHGTRLLGAMAGAVGGLSDRQPVREGAVQADRLDVIGEALQWMLERHFHGQLSAEVREAWSTAYPGLAHAVEHELLLHH